MLYGIKSVRLVQEQYLIIYELKIIRAAERRGAVIICAYGGYYGGSGRDRKFLRGFKNIVEKTLKIL